MLAKTCLLIFLDPVQETCLMDQICIYSGYCIVCVSYDFGSPSKEVTYCTIWQAVETLTCDLHKNILDGWLPYLYRGLVLFLGRYSQSFYQQWEVKGIMTLLPHKKHGSGLLLPFLCFLLSHSSLTAKKLYLSLPNRIAEYVAQNI